MGALITSKKPIAEYEIFSLLLDNVSQNPIEINNKESTIEYRLKFKWVIKVKTNNSHPIINIKIPIMNFFWYCIYFPHQKDAIN
jgi:hypothetical protein